MSDRIVRPFIRSGDTPAVARDTSKAFDSPTEFQVTYLVLFLLFSVIGGFRSFSMGNLQKNIQLMLEFLKGPLFVLHFSYYTSMIFLKMLAVILLSMPMILPLL